MPDIMPRSTTFIPLERLSEPFKGRGVCGVVSGGNVDADVFDGLVSR